VSLSGFVYFPPDCNAYSGNTLPQTEQLCENVLPPPQENPEVFVLCSHNRRKVANFRHSRESGNQIRDNPVDCVSFEFPPYFPVRSPLDPRLRGDDEGGGAEGLSLKSGKR
jgi:hypothetical protein